NVVGQLEQHVLAPVSQAEHLATRQQLRQVGLDPHIGPWQYDQPGPLAVERLLQSRGRLADTVSLVVAEVPQLMWGNNDGARPLALGDPRHRQGLKIVGSPIVNSRNEVAMDVEPSVRHGEESFVAAVAPQSAR